MDPNKTSPNPDSSGDTNKTPFDSVVDLVNEYGGAAKVPEHLLEQYGYSRRDDGTLAPVGLEVQKMWTMEDKRRAKPFEPFEVTLKGSIAPRHLDHAAIRRLIILAEDVDTFSLPSIELEYIANEEIVSRAKKIKIALMQAGSSNPLEQAFRGSELYNLTDFAPLNRAKRTIEPAVEIERVPGLTLRQTVGRTHNGRHLLEWAGIDLYADTIPKEEILRLSDLVERERGVVTDVDEIYKHYESWFATRIEDYDWAEFGELIDKQYEHLDEMERYNYIENPGEAIKELIDSLKSRGIETFGQYTMYMVGLLLDEMFPRSNKDSFTAETIKLRGIEEMAKYLFTVEQEQIDLAKKNLKIAKANLKLIPFGDANRQSAETLLKEAKDGLKDVKQKLLPLREAFERPYYVSRKANQAYDKLSQALIGGSNGELVLRFNSDVDDQLDSDPGVISGDCTAGNPLPFLSPNSLYNVKVFRESQHIGNIYLLQVVDKIDHKPYAWHLDAIQIPLNTDWKVAAPVIIEAMKQKATAKGVDHITINGQEHHISNYDYIADAFMEASDGIEFSPLAERILQTAKNIEGDNGMQMQAVDSEYFREL
jgi:hypothetical protein